MTFPAIPPGKAPSVPADPQAQVKARMGKLVRNVRASTRRGPIEQLAPLPIFDVFANTPTGLPVGAAWVPIPCNVIEADDDDMFTSGHAVVKRPGWYWVRASAGFAKASSNGTLLSIALSSTGDSSGIYNRSEDTTNATTTAFPVLRCGPIPLHLSTDDAVWLIGSWTGGTSGTYQTSNAAPIFPSLSLVCIRLD